MTTSALITMLLTWTIVTTLMLTFFIKVLRSPMGKKKKE